MKPLELAMLITLSAIWGLSFLLIRVAVPAMGPFALMDVRVWLAGAALLFYAAALGRRPALRVRWRGFLLLGFLNAALPFTLIAAAEIHLTGSLAAILNATVPLFTAAVAALALGDPFTLRKAAGLFLGLIGVAVSVGWSPLGPGAATWLSAGESLLAALSYALGTVYVARRLRGLAALEISIGQQLGAGILLLPLALLWPPPAWPSTTVAASVLALALLCTALAFIMFYGLVARVGPTSTVTVTFLVPVFSVIFGALFFGEPVGGGMLPGLGLIMISVMLVTGTGLPGFAPPARREDVRHV